MSRIKKLKLVRLQDGGSIYTYYPVPVLGTSSAKTAASGLAGLNLNSISGSLDMKNGVSDMLASAQAYVPKTGSIASGKSGIGAAIQSQTNLSGSNIMGAASTAISGIANAVSSKGKYTNAVASQTKSAITGAITAINPVIGMAMAATDMLGEALGTNLDTVNRESTDRLGINGGTAVGNNIVASIPVIGSLAGAFTGKTDEANMSEMTKSLSGAFGGTVGDISAAQDLSGKKVLFGKKKINAAIAEQNANNELITSIGKDAELAKSNTAGTYITQNALNAYAGGTNQLTLARKGKKLRIVRKPNNELIAFKKGGKFKSIIVSGALHARKHNIFEDNPELKEVITHKGVPVVVADESDITQIAEVEGGELILSKEITDKIEELYKLNTEESQLEAGKLLVKEILSKTIDKTNTIENG